MDYEAAYAKFFTTAPEGTKTPAAVSEGGPARQLRDALEPLAMHSVWSREVNDALAKYEIDMFGGYIYGRGVALGDVTAPVVTAALAVFSPDFVEARWTDARSKLERDQFIKLRDEGTAISLRKVLGDVTTEEEDDQVAATLERAADAADGGGRPVFAALRDMPRLTDPYARLWRAAELVREHRGGGHHATWVALGLTAPEINILTELWLDYPLGRYSNLHAWAQPDNEAAIKQLTVAGHIASWELTDSGREFRTMIEQRTDAAQDTLLGALGDQFEPVLEQVSSWSSRCVAAGLYPFDPRKRAAG